MKTQLARALSFAMAGVMTASSAFGRTPEPVRKIVEPVDLGTAAFDGDGQAIQLAERLTIERMGTNWIRLRIGKFQLGEDSFITISSLLDGRLQRHTADSLAEWDHWTAIFNGDAVDVVLHVAAAAVVNGGVVSIVEGNYRAADGNTFTAGADGKQMTLEAPVGIVTIGN